MKLRKKRTYKQEKEGCMPKILVVDDDRSMRDLVTDELIAEGYTAVGCADGIEALELDTATGPFYLVMTDLEMPRLNGPGLITELRVRHPEQRCILLSADPLRLSKAAAQLHVPYLSKPFRMCMLLNLMQEVFQSAP